MVTTEQKDRVKAAIEAYLQNGSQNELAQKCDVSSSTLSHIRRGTYTIGTSPISDNQFKKLMEFFGISEKVDVEKLHWQTDNFIRINNVCKVAQGDKRRALIDGNTGCGKTYALEHYYRNNSQVIYQKCTSSMKKKDLLAEIMEKLKIETDKKGDKAWMDAIRAKLTGNSGWLIIFDETEDVPEALYKAMKEIEDFTRGVCGMVICGAGIEKKLRGLAEKGRIGFPQLKRRFFPNVVRLHLVGRPQITQVLTHHSVTSKEVINWFCANIEDYDCLNQYLSDCLQYTEGNLGNLTPEILNALFKAY